MTKTQLSRINGSLLMFILSVAFLGLSCPAGAKVLHDRFTTVAAGQTSWGASLSPQAVYGDYAIVAESPTYGGQAYIFKKVGNTWAEQSRLETEESSEGVVFMNLEMQGDWLMRIGIQKSSTSAFGTINTIYIFKRDGEGWTESQQIQVSEFEEEIHFDTISIDGDRALFSGRVDPAIGTGRAAYVYRLEENTWIREARLEKEGSDFFDWGYGHIAAFFNNTSAVIEEQISYDGSPNYYYFKRNGNDWTLEPWPYPSGLDDSIEPWVETAYQFLIETVSDSDSGNGQKSYEVRVFKKEGASWTEEPRLPYPGPKYDDVQTMRFSYSGSVEIYNDDYLVVTSSVMVHPLMSISSPITHHVWLYKFQDGAWTLLGPLTTCSGICGDGFGTTIVMEGGELLIGSSNGVYAYTIDPEDDLNDEGDLEGFDKAYYLTQKLAHQQSVSPEWAGRTTAEYEAYLKGEGYTAESHYSRWGYTEGLEPNAWFNHSEYTLAMSRYLVQQGIYPSVQDAMAAVESSWTGDFYLHYLLWGYSAGVNPSNSFDESLYLEDKLAFLQAGGTWSDRTVSDLKSYYNNLEMSVVEDYVLRGEGEGLIPQSAPEGERADICATDLPFDSVDILRCFDKDWYLSAKLSHQQAVSPEWAGKTTEEYECYLRQAGYSAQSHYTRWGYLEDLSPNPYFDHSEYLDILSQRLVNLGVYTSLEDAGASVQAAWPGDLYQHYLAWGAGDGLDPSYSFDESQYLSDRLSLLQAGGEWIGKTVDDLRTYFTAQGTTVLEDYLENGEALGLTPEPVSKSN